MSDDFRNLIIALVSAIIIVGGSVFMYWFNTEFPLDDIDNDPFKKVVYTDSVWDANTGFNYSQK